MMNHIVLIGRLTADPEIRMTQSGIPVANFQLAVDRRFKNANGERETDFIRIVAWRKLAELIRDYTHKGYLVAVDGSLQVRRYQTPEGENRTVYEVQADNVQFLDRGGRGAGGDSSYAPPSDQDAPPPPPEPSSQSGRPGDDSDLPF
ncbi:MAG: single-stranded DNA-binding protein [Candidatus Omnitrophota bacterium]